MDYVHSVRNFLGGFRVPDFSRIWNGSSGDEVDAGQEQTSIRFEYYLVRYQELALWTDPKSSLTALFVVHLAFGYLAATSSTPINLALWVAICGFVYATWTQRIWPEIRVKGPDADSGPPPAHPDVYNAKEVAEYWNLLKQKSKEHLTRLVEMRRERPAKFCCVASAAFLVLAYVGTAITAIRLLYCVVVGSLTVPFLLRNLMVKYPSLNSCVETLRLVKKEVKETGKDSVDGPSGSVVANVMQTVQSTLQSGVSALSSNLSDLGQLKSNLQNEVAQRSRMATKGNDEPETEDDLKPYMPSGDDHVLEGLVDACGQAPSEPKVFPRDEGEEDNSLIEGIEDGMPSHDELEQSSSFSSIPKSVLAEAAKDISEEFSLDSPEDSLLLPETVGEESHLAEANSTDESHRSIPQPKEDGDKVSEEDDFELISAEELS